VREGEKEGGVAAMIAKKRKQNAKTLTERECYEEERRRICERIMNVEEIRRN